MALWSLVSFSQACPTCFIKRWPVPAQRPIPHTAHFRDPGATGIGYSFEVRPTYRLLNLHEPFAEHTTLPFTTHTTSYSYRPVTVKAVYLYMPHCTSVVIHLTLNHGFPIVWLSRREGSIDPTESLAERQRRSPHWQVPQRFEPGTSGFEVQCSSLYATWPLSRILKGIRAYFEKFCHQEKLIFESAKCCRISRIF